MTLELWKKRVKAELMKLRNEEENRDLDKIKDVWVQNWQQSKEHTLTTRIPAKQELNVNFKKVKPLPPSTGANAATPPPSVAIKLSNGDLQTAPIIMLNSVEPLPAMPSWVFLQRNFEVEDETTLSHLPYVGDDMDKSTFMEEHLRQYNNNIKGDKLLDDDMFLKLVRALMENYDVENAAGATTTAAAAEKQQQVVEAPEAVAKPPAIEMLKRRSRRLSISRSSLSSTQVTPQAQKPVAPETATAAAKDDEKTKAKPQLSKSDLIFKAISQLFRNMPDKEALAQKYAILLEATTEKANEAQKVENVSALLKSEAFPNVDSPQAEPGPRQKVMSSFHTLFCRRCFMYDCQLHKNERVTPKLKAGFVPMLNNNSLCSPKCYMLLEKNKENIALNSAASGCNKTRKLLTFLQDKGNAAVWTGGDLALYDALVKVFPNNYCKLAEALMTKTCQQVYEHAQSLAAAAPSLQKGEPKQPTAAAAISPTPFKPGRKASKDLRIGTASYVPCDHEGPCNELNCDCIRGRNYCERFCNCMQNCPNRFPGCRCKSQCNTKRCICYVAGRECDPDICRGSCGAGEFEIEKVLCRNVNMQRNLHKHLLMARSDVAGWGIFAKSAIPKNDFIYEYCGEIVSHDEADRRGHLYDKLKCSYLFNLNDEYCVDAKRKGNKIRFANHSQQPNCYVKILRVNGDYRIGVFALENIDAGEELFFDYRYGQNARLKFVANERSDKKALAGGKAGEKQQ